jgi:hypothetical protein
MLNAPWIFVGGGLGDVTGAGAGSIGQHFKRWPFGPSDLFRISDFELRIF